MVVASQLVAKVSDEGADATTNKMHAVGASVDEAAGKIRAFALGATVVGVAALVGIGIASTKMAGDFQSSMTSLVTGAGESANNIKMVSDGILNMAGPVATTTKQLADGMYLIESSGQHGTKALQTLRDAAMGAKVGSADLGVVADGVTTIMTDYAAANVSSAQATNTLIATVASGKTKMGDLAASLAEILPTASSAGVGLTDVSAGMATLTAAGVPASQAATYLRQTILALNAPTDQARRALEDVGLTTDAVSEAMKKSLPDALALITDAIGKQFPVGSAAYIDAMKNIVGGTDQLQGILGLTGDHLQTFRDNVTGITKSVNEGGNSITGWSKVQENFNFKMDQAKEVLETTGIKIGTVLLPVVGKLVDGISSPAFQAFANTLAGGITTALLGIINAVSTLVTVGTNLTNFFQHNQAALTALQAVLIPVAGVIAGVLVFAFWSWAKAAAGAAIATLTAAAPFIVVIAAIALLAAGFILLYNNSAPFRAIIASIGQYISSNFLPIMRQIGQEIQNAWMVISTNFIPIMRQVWSVLLQIGSFLAATFKPAWDQLVTTWQTQLLPAFRQLWTAINQVQMAMQPLQPMLQVIAAIAGGILAIALGVLIGLLVGLFQGLARALPGIIQFFGGIVQIISGAIQIIIGIISFFVDLFTGKWSKLGADIGIILQGIITLFTGFGNVFMGIFNAAVGFVTGLIMGFISGIIGFFTFLYHALVGGSIIPDLVNGIIDWIAQLPGRAMAFIGSLVSSVIGGLATMVSQGVAQAINFVGGIIGQIGQVAGRAGAAMNSARDTILSILGGIASSAFNAGASIVKGIADGITAAIHWVTDAISNVTNWISAHLPHSPAKVGPLRFLAEQGESITAQISEGMLRGLPRLHGALGDLIEPLSMNVNGAALSTNAPIVPSQFYQAAQPRIIINLPDIILDGHRLTRAQMPYIAREIKDGTGMWGM